jgi:hypothetical protein
VSAIEGRQLSLFSYEDLCGEGRPAVVGAEPRERPEAPTRSRNSEADELDVTTGNTRDLLERVCERGNMLTACDRVVRNAGAGGVDGMGCAEIPAWLETTKQYIDVGKSTLAKLPCRPRGRRRHGS